MQRGDTSTWFRLAVHPQGRWVATSGSAGLNKVAWGMTKTPAGAPAQPAQGGGFRRQRVPPAPLGEYTVVMSVNGREMSKTVSILKDEWWMNRR